ncbi:hypothetical protein FO488_03995 [Geobacter sp. FeAm09]|uniref:hypothetical protein n=1 Tax=Geobacter sp. FeAm09 TaxID=2597769 RepID=UPI0011EBEDB4|nr:hypothetical protein [Geobacter sp. FeAm09]QEM67390.1 hypothetical protein FO488_03995 [Geobacter sp. FeAm09]
MKTTLKLILATLTLAALYGCGGGGNGSSTPTAVADSYVFPSGTATITFSAMSTAQLAAPVSGIDFTVTLPAGMTPTTAGGASGQIDSTTITAGSALTGTNLAFGTYSVSTRKAHLSMATTSNSYRSGEFLRLTCTVASGTSITLAQFKAANDPVTIIKAVGYDSATASTVVLTDKLKVTIGAVR